jgi:hypothetical protein
LRTIWFPEADIYTKVLFYPTAKYLPDEHTAKLVEEQNGTKVERRKKEEMNQIVL